MNYQINTYFILISLILGFIISLFYVRKFNLLFLGNFIIISLIFLILFYFLGERKELFKNQEIEDFQNEESEESILNDEEQYPNQFTEEEHSKNNKQEEEYSMEETEEEHKRKTFQEELQEQEEHIKQSQEMEEMQEEIKSNMEEEENVKHTIRKKEIQDNKIQQNIASAIPNTSGIGNLNINISCGGNNGNSGSGPPSGSNNQDSSQCSIDTNNSRIYNNSDWAYDSSYWKNNPNSYSEDSYNYNKLEPCSKDENGNYLLPCIQPEANKIPQTLNNLLNARKTNDSEVCPLEINKPWSNYKTGDDDESNEILPEGYNI